MNAPAASEAVGRGWSGTVVVVGAVVALTVDAADADTDVDMDAERDVEPDEPPQAERPTAQIAAKAAARRTGIESRVRHVTERQRAE